MRLLTHFVALAVFAIPTTGIAQTEAPEAESAYRVVLNGAKTVNKKGGMDLEALSVKVDAALAQMEDAGLKTSFEVKDQHGVFAVSPAKPAPPTSSYSASRPSTFVPYHAGLQTLQRALAPIVGLRLSREEVATSAVTILKFELRDSMLRSADHPPEWNGTLYPVISAAFELAVPYASPCDKELVRQVHDACPYVPATCAVDGARKALLNEPQKSADDGRRFIAAVLASTGAPSLPTELTMVRPPPLPPWEQAARTPKKWTEAGEAAAAAPFNVKFIEPTPAWPKTGPSGPTDRDELQARHEALMLGKYRASTMLNCAVVVNRLVVEPAVAAAKEMAEKAELARIEEVRQEQERAAQEEANAKKQQTIERHRRDPKFAAPVLSARLCQVQEIRNSYLKAISDEKSYAANVGGVVDLAKLHRLQDSVHGADQMIAGIRKKMGGIKGVTAMPCSNKLVRRISMCLAASEGATFQEDFTCDDLEPYTEIAETPY